MNNTVKEGKTKAILSYFTFVGMLITWSINQEEKNTFASFHIRQNIGLNALFFCFAVLISGFNTWFITLPFWLIFIMFWAFGFIGALQGKLSYIPIVGSYFQKWFKKIA